VFEIEAVAVGLALFLLLIVMVVMAFTGFQISILLSGKTGRFFLSLYIDAPVNETYKWDDVQAAIRSGEISEWHIELREYNQKYKRGLRYDLSDDEHKGSGAAYQRKRDKLKKEKKVMVPVTSIKDFRNIYDRGAWRNLIEVLYPAPL
jgi:hypothetical protein